jgi:hypothetical protein
MRKISSIIFLVLISEILSAQKISIGIETGLVSSINSDYSLKDFENRRNSYYSGLNVNYHHNEKFTFMTGVHYLRQGYRHKTCYIFEEGVKNELVGEIDYLIVPLTLNFNFSKSKRILTSLGVYGAYNIRAIQDYPEPVGGCAIYYIPDLSDYTEKYSVGAIIGAGYRVFNKEKLEINTIVKYYQGLRNASKVDDIKINRKYSSILLTLTINYKIVNKHAI